MNIGTRLRAGLVLLACLVSAGGGGLLRPALAAGAAPEASDPAARAREILHHPWYQKALPVVDSELPEAIPPAAARPPMRRPIRLEDDDFRIRPTPVPGVIKTVIIGLGLIFMIGYGLRYVADAWPDLMRRRDRVTPAAPLSAGGEAPRSRDIPGDAEELAAAGRYAEAIHALLLRVFGSLMTRGTAIDATLTAREILRIVNLESGAKQALRELVQAVEMSTFAGRPATERDFLASREAYERLRDVGDGVAP